MRFIWTDVKTVNWTVMRTEQPDRDRLKRWVSVCFQVDSGAKQTNQSFRTVENVVLVRFKKMMNHEVCSGSSLIIDVCIVYIVLPRLPCNWSNTFACQCRYFSWLIRQKLLKVLCLHHPPCTLWVHVCDSDPTVRSPESLLNTTPPFHPVSACQSSFITCSQFEV